MSLTIITILEFGFTISESRLLFMGFSSAFLIKEVESSFLSGSEGKITLEMFLSGISSSIVELPKANEIFFMFTVMFMPTLSPVLKIIRINNIKYAVKAVQICGLDLYSTADQECWLWKC